MIRLSKSKQNGTKLSPGGAAPEVLAFFDAALAILNRVAAGESAPTPAPARKETIPT